MKTKVFPGWYLVFAAHVLLALIFGAAYSFGAFFSHLQANFDAGRFSVASVFSLTAFIYYAIGVVSGSLADRFSTRAVVSAGVMLLALGFFVSSKASGSLQLFIASFCSLVGLGVGLVYVPTVTAVQRWFVRNRSQASGIALAGTGVGTFIGPLAAGLLMQHFSWETTMRLFALVILVSGLWVAMLVRGQPQELGLLPDGDQPSASSAGPQTSQQGGMRLAEALASARFWWYFGAIFCGSVGLFIALVHINPYAQQFAISTTQANLLIGLIGAGNVAGRLFLGTLGDRLGARRLLLLLTGALVALNLFWVGAQGFVTLALFAVLFGVANGGCIALYPSVAATWFGTRHLGAILGALYVSVGIAALVGGSLGGLLFDLYQGYAASILLGAACALLSVVLILIAGRQGVQLPAAAASSRS
ncbi:MFS transporter [Pseudomonas sp. TKO26]|uniref:MFS transporter n=1 Tax=unclassified Pseudomonas TaxID=196821 RepID=UPI000D825C00|nr:MULTISPECIES: MFS transporter [unclassified Pseudomonas]PYY84767.1 MFS transporter [Pseudomonas sp. TKO30]PYY86676.1 MFS transporter [Pseudomonas sp. TKO29]PYY89318.1 MFS transporter [Pseudomonas sp. TKO26]PYY99147.1 MFS transporter [Pseudomonas sp. TKO14]